MPDLGQLDHGRFEGGDGAGVAAFQGDLHEGLESHADGGRVSEGAVAGDDAAAFQFTQPPVAGAGCEPHPVGEFGDRRLPSACSSARIARSTESTPIDYCQRSLLGSRSCKHSSRRTT